MNIINWEEVVELARSPQDRRIKSLNSKITRSISITVLFTLTGIVCLGFTAYDLSPSGPGLDETVGKLVGLAFIASTILSVKFFFNAVDAKKEKDYL